jgi:predicted PhzF superfamily epimerase YddE/YHI9
VAERRAGVNDVEVNVVRVFCGERGTGGNELGVVIDGGTVAEDDRQGLAQLLGYSETVFVDDPEQGRIRIYTPAIELPFAGHPVVGTGWLLAREGYPAETLLTQAGKVTLDHRKDGTAAAVGLPDWCPAFELLEHSSPEEIDALEPGGEGWYYVWAWIDEEAGLVRARSFVPEAGIAEDEATGSAALRLCAELGREIEVHQGRGSVIHARPVADGAVEISGAVVAE